MNYKKATENIRQELKTYLTENNIKSLVLGISGGIDSALCAALARPICDEIGIPLIGRSLPTRTNADGENSRAEEIGEIFCTDFKETNIQSSFASFYDVVVENFPNGTDGVSGKKESILKGNIKARIRMIFLYDIAGGTNGMVLSTDNWTEYLLGFWTLHGDVGDYGMIQELWKTEVYEMSEWLVKNELEGDAAIALQNCVECQATDGLGITNSDLDQILPGWEGSSKDGYAVVDKSLSMYVNFGIEIETLDKAVIDRYHKSKFKRNNPLNISRDKIEK